MNAKPISNVLGIALWTLAAGLVACSSSASSTGSGTISSGATSGASQGTGGSTASSPPSCDSICAHVGAVCGQTPSSCVASCGNWNAATRACVGSISSCQELNACVTSGASTNGGSGTTTTGSSGGSTSGTTGSSSGTCPSLLHSGQTCPGPCGLQGIDGKSMCLQPCTSSADCTDATYSYCNTQLTSANGSHVCVPHCASSSDCTPYGFNFCTQGAGFCQ